MISALEECYGVGSVSLLSAAFRWLNHHSAMSPEYGGEGGWEAGRGVKREAAKNVRRAGM